MNESRFAGPTNAAPPSRLLRAFRLDRRGWLLCALLVASIRLAVLEKRPVPTYAALDSGPLVRPLPLPAPLASPTVRLPVLMSESAAWRVTEVGRRNASADRREKFEAEYGIAEREPLLALGAMQTAKYNLDTILFTVDDFTRNLSDSLQFEYDAGRLQHVSVSGERPRRNPSNLRVDVGKNARLGLDLNLTDGKPYVGVKLALPLGN
ncbi:MAG TPA: hypothetical protein VL486_12535 [Verrucomicrobiae bacterium]|nr:hypothetical protein [Verrucomicrobiae bacterium]